MSGKPAFGIGSESYASWEEARAASTGYDAADIADRALRAALAVKRGEAVFERDTFLFHEPQVRWHLLACVASAAASVGGPAHVLDVGGSFASVYLQHARFLERFSDLRWSIVEQPHIAAAGRQHLEGGRLRFFETIEAAQRAAPATMAVFSGSLQFMAEPYAMLARAAGTGCTHLLIDRITLSGEPADRITVYRVHEDIYPGSYPQWVLSEANVRAFLADRHGFAEVARYVDGIDGDDHVGILFARPPAGRVPARGALSRLRALVPRGA